MDIKSVKVTFRTQTYVVLVCFVVLNLLEPEFYI